MRLRFLDIVEKLFTGVFSSQKVLLKGSKILILVTMYLQAIALAPYFQQSHRNKMLEFQNISRDNGPTAFHSDTSSNVSVTRFALGLCSTNKRE